MRIQQLTELVSSYLSSLLWTVYCRSEAAPLLIMCVHRVFITSKKESGPIIRECVASAAPPPLPHLYGSPWGRGRVCQGPTWHLQPSQVATGNTEQIWFDSMLFANQLGIVNALEHQCSIIESPGSVIVTALVFYSKASGPMLLAFRIVHASSFIGLKVAVLQEKRAQFFSVSSK